MKNRALGRLVVSLGGLAAEARISRLAADRQLQRLGSGVALLPGQPRSYLIVPPEHRRRGAPPLAGWRRALHEAVPVSVRQRLGYVLTLLNLESYAAMVEKSLPSRLSPTVLQTRSPASKSRLKPSTPFYIFENVDIRSDR
jgi:hypothetical protein